MLCYYFMGSLFVENARTPGEASPRILIVAEKLSRAQGMVVTLWGGGKPQANRCFPLA